MSGGCKKRQHALIALSVDGAAAFQDDVFKLGPLEAVVAGRRGVGQLQTHACINTARLYFILFF